MQIIYIYVIKYNKTKLRFTIMTWERRDISVCERMCKEILKLTRPNLWRDPTLCKYIQNMTSLHRY